MPDVTVLLPKGAYGVGATGWAWIPKFSAPSREAYQTRLAQEVETTNAQLWAEIDGARAKGVAWSDIYVGGSSQGGWFAANTALREPPDWALGGVIVMSGGGVEMDRPPATGLPPLRVLVTHGSSDRVVNIAKGRQTAEHFAAGNHDVAWLTFDGPHTIGPEVRATLPAFLRGETVGQAVKP